MRSFYALSFAFSWQLNYLQLGTDWVSPWLQPGSFSRSQVQILSLSGSTAVDLSEWGQVSRSAACMRKTRSRALLGSFFFCCCCCSFTVQVLCSGAQPRAENPVTGHNHRPKCGLRICKEMEPVVPGWDDQTGHHEAGELLCIPRPS